MKTLSMVVIVNGKKYMIRRWKPEKGRAYYQLFKYVNNGADLVYTLKDFSSIKKAKDYIKSLND